MDSKPSSDPGRPTNRAPLRGSPGGDDSPLRTRSRFLERWTWESVVRLNRGACLQSGAQHGPGSETHDAVRKAWQSLSPTAIPLIELITFLRQCQRRAPFLFHNADTFAEVGRQLTASLLTEFPAVRRRMAASAVAHHIAGLLTGEQMAEILDSLSHRSRLQPGDRVKTLRGSTCGTVLALREEDGRVVWKPDESDARLITLPESLLRLAE